MARFPRPLLACPILLGLALLASACGKDKHTVIGNVPAFGRVDN